MMVMMPEEHRSSGKTMPATVEGAEASAVKRYAAAAKTAAMKHWTAAAETATAAMKGCGATVETTTAMEAATAVETTATMKAATMETSAATMETSAAAMETATTAVETSTTAVAATDFGDQRARGMFCHLQGGGIDRRERFCALTGRHDQHRGGRDAKRLLEIRPET